MSGAKQTFEVAVIGCDARTTVRIDLNNDELQLLERLADQINSRSEYSCQPRMEIARLLEILRRK